jgi:hypothetical protein
VKTVRLTPPSAASANGSGSLRSELRRAVGNAIVIWQSGCTLDDRDLIVGQPV